ncbi:MAG: peptidoglycan DD-metalloendopeptidase family protein [Gammaproteobacteria bacterium]
MKRGFLIPMAAIFPLAAMAAVLPKNEPVPGGVIVMQLPASNTAPVVHFDGHRIMVVNYESHWYAVTGIPLSTAPGEKTLDVKTVSEPLLQLKFSIVPKEYPEQRLVIKNPKLVNPSARELDRIEREQAHLHHVLNRWVPDHAPDLSFIWPAKGPETSGFGLRRFYNGEARSPHSGIDLGAPAGSRVLAPADGVVADVGDYYFCGHTLTIDLGQGLYSVYCHLSKITVTRGQHVKQGQAVGNIGATGRTTGPNLHWTVSLNGTPVDPHAFIPASVIQKKRGARP